MTSHNTADQERNAIAGDDPGPENHPLFVENPDSNLPPATDHGNPGPLWYSFDLAPKRVQPGGWTHQVTQRELPSSTDIAGVNMRLTDGSFRELHWHHANEWALMLTGKARVTLFQPNGKMFIDDLEAGDLWYFPAGMPHSIQGLGGDGCEFLLVFDQGDFSEDDTFLLSEFFAHTSPELVSKNTGWTEEQWKQLPSEELYIFPAALPDSLEADKKFLGDRLETVNRYTFKRSEMEPAQLTSTGSAYIIDSKNFPVSTGISAAIVTIKPGAMREMHWHPNTGEWQYWLQGKGRMTVVTTGGTARTMDFNANDVGFVPSMAGHCIENTGTEDIIFLEAFKHPTYADISLNQWIARMPDKMAQAHLKLDVETIRSAPQEREATIAKKPRS